MNTYEIAGLKVNMECADKTAAQAEKYKVDYTDEVVGVLQVSEEKKQLYLEKHPELSEESYCYISLCIQLASLLLDHDGFVLHASAIEYNNNAYLFSADSGTGKSTHTRLWQKCFEDARVFNDDKPAIRLIDDKFYAYGTPFSGSTPINLNVRVPLKAICFIERADKNSIELMQDNAEIIHKILSQTLRKTGNEKVEKLFVLLDKLLKTVPVYKLKCRPDEDAARLAYSVMSK